MLAEPRELSDRAYAHAHGVIDNNERGPASHRLNTFPRQLQRAGYDTAFVGKWHMGNDDSPRPGFDLWVSFKGQGQYLDPEMTEGGRTAPVQGYVTDILNARAVDNMGYQALRTECWKYIRYTELKGMNEVYDLRADPYKMKNLIADAARKADLRRLRDELDRLVQSGTTHARVSQPTLSICKEGLS